jgi:hypothetical protein
LDDRKARYCLAEAFSQLVRQFSSPIFGRFCGMNKGNDRLIRDGRLDLVEARDHRSRLVGESETLPEIVPEKTVDVLGQGLRNLDLGLEGAGEEATFGRLFHHVGTSRHPGPSAWQLVPEIGHDLVIGPEDKADQSRGAVRLAGNDAGALRFMPRHGC